VSERPGPPAARAAGLEPPDPPLHDEVVLLRPWGLTDATQIHAACQDPRIQQYIPIPRPYAFGDAEDYIERTHRQWASGEKAAFAMTDVNDPSIVLGAVSLAVVQRIGNAAYWVVPEVRGLGLATRSLRLVTHWGMSTLGLGVVLLEIHHANAASIHVAETSGYHLAGQLEVPDARGGRSHLLYAHLAADPEAT
jgi:RimJ/RimL family protein N-acetyltransferase